MTAQAAAADQAQARACPSAEPIAPGTLVMVYRNAVDCLHPAGPAQVMAVRGPAMAVDYFGRPIFPAAVRLLLTGEVRERAISEPLAECWERWQALDAQHRKWGAI